MSLDLDGAITVVDSHTVGEPTRFVASLAAALPGATMLDRRAAFERHFAGLRRRLVHEPRGHDGMFLAVLTSPVGRDSDFGLLFFDPAGPVDMCVHATVGAVVSMRKLGLLPLGERPRAVRIDTCAGMVVVEPSETRPHEVRITGRPSYRIARAVQVVSDGARITMDVAYGGNVFGLVAASELGLEVRRASLTSLVTRGIDVLREAREQLRLTDPVTGAPVSVAQLLVHGTPTVAGAHAKNIVLSGTAKFDRSPCGTGTCARMSQLHADGDLGVGETFVNEGIMGTTFTGRVAHASTRGGVAIIEPHVTASAYVVGIAQLVLEAADPFPEGFQPAAPRPGEPGIAQPDGPPADRPAGIDIADSDARMERS